jgi:hypothetical protein
MAGIGQSFWPEDIDVGVLSPREILETQAKALAEITKGLVTAEIMETTDTSDPKGLATQLQLVLIAPNLSYRRQILTIRHAFQLVYPATVDAECFREKDLFATQRLIKDTTGLEWPTNLPTPTTAVTDRDLETLIKTVLRSAEVKSVLTSLIAKSKEMLRSQGLAVPQK